MLNRESRSGMSENELALVESEGVEHIDGHNENDIDDLIEKVGELGGTEESILPKEMYQRILELQSTIDGGDTLPAALSNELVHLRDVEKRMLREWIKARKANSEQQKEAA